MQYLSARPQYAYTPGKAIDEAIAQVMQHCATCRYRVMHKGYARDFPMKRGLSPYLYAMFTCLLHDEIAECTSREWAARAATLFADDTHLSWDISAESDLRFVMHCVQRKHSGSYRSMA